MKGTLYPSRLLLAIAYFWIDPVESFKACVTGGTGFLGSELVSQLLEAGNDVHATVRCMEDPKTVFLKELRERCEPGQLEIFQADLTDEGSFNKAIQGCNYVFHVAGPFTRELIGADEDTIEEEIIEPILFGMSNVVEFAQKEKSVQRIVLTSSTAALRGPGEKPSAGRALFTEEDWNTASRRDGPGMEPYQWAKTVAERGALNQGRIGGTPVVSIVSGFMLGPPRSAALCEGGGVSVQTMRAWAAGDFGSDRKLIADVRDVARAHILAATEDYPMKDNGARFIVSADERAWAGPVGGGGSGAAGASIRDAFVLQTAGVRELDAGRARALLGLAPRPPAETVADFLACEALAAADDPAASSPAPPPATGAGAL